MSIYVNTVADQLFFHLKLTVRENMHVDKHVTNCIDIERFLGFCV